MCNIKGIFGAINWHPFKFLYESIFNDHIPTKSKQLKFFFREIINLKFPVTSVTGFSTSKLIKLVAIFIFITVTLAQ